MDTFGEDDEIVQFGQDDEVIPFGQNDNLEQAVQATPPVSPPKENSTFVDTVTGALAMNPLGTAYDYLTSDKGWGEAAVDVVNPRKPAAEQSFLENATEGYAGGAINTVRNAAILGGAVADAGIDMATPDAIVDPNQPGLTELAQENMPQFHPEGGVQEAFSIGAEVVNGMIIGNKVAAAAKLEGLGTAAAAKLAKEVPQLVNGFTKFLGRVAMNTTQGVGGGMVTMGSDSDNAIVGDNAVFGTWVEGLPMDNPDEAMNVLAGRVNLGLDALLTGAGVSGFMETLRAGYQGFLRPTVVGKIKTVFSADERIRNVFESIGEELKKITPDATDEALKATWQRVRDLAANIDFQRLKKNVGVEGVQDIDAPLDVATTIGRQVDETSTPLDQGIKNVMNAEAKSIASKGYEATATRQEMPVREMNRVLEQSERVFGRDETVAKSAKRLTDIGQAEVDTAADAATKAADDAVTMKDTIVRKTLEADPNIGGRIQKEAEAGFRERGTDFNKSRKDLLEQTNRGVEVAQKESQAAWKALRESGVDFPDRPKWEAVIEANKADLPTDILEEIQKRSPNLSKAHGDLLAYLVNARKDMIRKGLKGSDQRKALTAIDHIQQEILDQSGKVGGEFKDIFERATDSFNRWRSLDQGVVEQMADITAANKGKPVNQSEEQTQTLLKTIKGRHNPEKMQHYVDALDSEEFGKSVERVKTYTLDHIVDDLSETVRLGKVTPEQVSKILNDYRSILTTKQMSDVGDMIGQLEKDVLATKGQVKDAEAFAIKAKEMAEATRDKIYNNVLSDFFRRTGKSFEATSNPQAAFQEMLDSKEALGKIKGILDLAKDDPLVMDALKASYAQAFKNSLYKGEVTAIGGTRLSAAGVRSVLNNEGFINAGREIFKDTPGWMMAMEDTLTLSADIAKSQALKMAPADWTSRIPESAKAALKKILNPYYGPLSHRALQINTLWSTILEVLGPQGAIDRVRDALLSDPQAFVKAYDEFAAAKGGRKMWEKSLKTVINTLIHDDAERNEFKRKFDLKQTEMETEAALERDKNKKKN